VTDIKAVIDRLDRWCEDDRNTNHPIVPDIRAVIAEVERLRDVEARVRELEVALQKIVELGGGPYVLTWPDDVASRALGITP
jgi:hypothetical protein